MPPRHTGINDAKPRTTSFSADLKENPGKVSKCNPLQVFFAGIESKQIEQLRALACTRTHGARGANARECVIFRNLEASNARHSWSVHP
ncbi:hypothetical protein PT2222_470008 [Paraburkholderia tropica]